MAQFTGIEKCLLVVPGARAARGDTTRRGPDTSAPHRHTHAHTQKWSKVSVGVVAQFARFRSHQQRRADAEIAGQQVIVGTVGKLLDLLQPRGYVGAAPTPTPMSTPTSTPTRSAKPKFSAQHLKIIVRAARRGAARRDTHCGTNVSANSATSSVYVAENSNTCRRDRPA